MLYPSRAATRACGRELGGMRVQLPPCFVAGAMAQGCVWIRAAGRRAAARGLAAGAGMDMATQPKRRHRRQLAALPERQLGDSCFPCCAWAPRRPGRSSAVAAAVCAAAECAPSVLQLLWAASGVLAGAHVAGSDLTLGGRGTQHAGQLRQGCAHAVQRFSRRHHRHGHSGHHHLHCEERRLLRVQQLRRGHAVPFVLDWQRPRCRLGGCVP